MNFEKLWRMERSFWLDGPAFYEKSMAPGACMIFPLPVGILAGKEIIEGLRVGPRWKAVDFESKTETCLRDTAVLAYKASGQRDGQDPYVALCMSTYVRNDDMWVLLAHQQTPEM